jgi:hypothetical protein
VGVTARAEHRFGTVVVIGGGCYGTQYVRQLLRARDAGRAEWLRLVAVDRDARCRLAAEYPADAELVTAEWSAFLATFLAAAASAPDAHAADAVVPSPLMPHVLFDWVRARAAAALGADVPVVAPPELPGVPWQRLGMDQTRYVSHATWICPVNCIEPATCPHTKGPRTWSFHEGLAGALGDTPVAVLRVTHRVFGVGMVDVSDILAADRMATAQVRAGRPVGVATASRCHGAIGVLEPRATVSPTSHSREI